MFDDREALAATPAHGLALDCLEAGIEAVRPARAVARHCSVENDVLRIRDETYDLSTYDDVVVLGGGKVADGLANALEDLLGDHVTGGVVVTDEPTTDVDRVDVRVGEHPIPGENSVTGTAAVLDGADSADERTLVIAAITGGGSALLCAPASGLSVDDVGTVTGELLAAGAAVDEVNAVRRACSRIKGGGLVTAAAPATVVGVLVSDVVGDDPSIIASGPTTPVETDPTAALAVLDRYDVEASSVRAWLAEQSSRPPPPGGRVPNHVIASSRDAVEAARSVAADRGYDARVLSTTVEGEAREAGRFHAAIAREVVASGEPVDPPAVLLSAGETTVRVTGDGRGGPNLEFALAGAVDLPADAILAAVDTDGRDGSTEAAGALVDAATVEDAARAESALAENDSYHFLERRTALLVTGATGTNVNDLRVIAVPN